MTASEPTSAYAAAVLEILDACRDLESYGGSAGRLRKLMVLLTRGHFGDTVNYASAFPALACLQWSSDPAKSTLGIDLEHTPGVGAENKDAGIYIGVRRITSHKMVLNDSQTIEPGVEDEPEQGIEVSVRKHRVDLTFTAIHSSLDVVWDLIESLMEFLMGVKASVVSAADLDEYEINEAVPRRRNPQTTDAQHAVTLSMGLAYHLSVSTQSRSHILRSVMTDLQAEHANE